MIDVSRYAPRSKREGSLRELSVGRPVPSARRRRRLLRHVDAAMANSAARGRWTRPPPPPPRYGAQGFSRAPRSTHRGLGVQTKHFSPPRTTTRHELLLSCRARARARRFDARGEPVPSGASSSAARGDGEHGGERGPVWGGPQGRRPAAFAERQERRRRAGVRRVQPEAVRVIRRPARPARAPEPRGERRGRGESCGRPRPPPARPRRRQACAWRTSTA